MKRLVLKQWVVQVLALIIGISVVIMASDCENTMTFVISHIVASGVFIGCWLILKRFASKKIFE